MTCRTLTPSLSQIHERGRVRFNQQVHHVINNPAASILDCMRSEHTSSAERWAGPLLSEMCYKVQMKRERKRARLHTSHILVSLPHTLTYLQRGHLAQLQRLNLSRPRCSCPRWPCHCRTSQSHHRPQASLLGRRLQAACTLPTAHVGLLALASGGWPAELGQGQWDWKQGGAGNGAVRLASSQLCRDCVLVSDNGGGPGVAVPVVACGSHGL